MAKFANILETVGRTPLFADGGVDMNEDEVKISNSTPNHRMAPKAA
jgi:hypothetical protein